MFVTYDGQVKVLDFGIAKILNPELAADSIDPTATAMRMMTPEYASPEQVRGEPVTTMTDVYALGVVLWECIAGRGLWDGPDLTSMITRQMTEAVPKLSRVGTYAPWGWTLIAGRRLTVADRKSVV